MSAPKYDEPRCKHSGSVHRVTSLADGERLLATDPHASVWVCERRACVLDAMAWVERLTELRALVYDANRERVEI